MGKRAIIVTTFNFISELLCSFTMAEITEGFFMFKQVCRTTFCLTSITTKKDAIIIKMIVKGIPGILGIQCHT
ncbi:MAG: hypothetical protein TQ37_07655 [Candidatus Synechococcus spongiarum 15L]|uniref:Uncharacterized protein n=1 Tax=Candidatus Synechococcus spongiarum 15L TaxID=1608419 RepID=A0A0G8ATD4_9SYNE|nr:MAG: hypothetical protein TQ37_07655 [Candidatus Synechococcus spongiarum 15L]